MERGGLTQKLGHDERELEVVEDKRSYGRMQDPNRSLQKRSQRLLCCQPLAAVGHTSGARPPESRCWPGFCGTPPRHWPGAGTLTAPRLRCGWGRAGRASGEAAVASRYHSTAECPHRLTAAPRRGLLPGSCRSLLTRSSIAAPPPPVTHP